MPGTATIFGLVVSSYTASSVTFQFGSYLFEWPSYWSINVGDSYSVTVNGATYGGTVTLGNVTAANPVFSNLTSSSSINYGTGNVTFSGKITAGNLTPPNTETVAITLNGVTGNATINASGNFTTTFNTSTLPASVTPYQVTYSYAGDAGYSSVTDNTTTKLTVDQNATATTVTASVASPVCGESVLFTATVIPANGSGETGNVTFQIDGGNTATVAVTGNTASYRTSTLSVGNHTVVALYTGDGNFSGSVSATFTITVAPLVTITVTPPGNQTMPPGQSYWLALGSFTQSYATGPYSVTVNWGDGSTESIVAIAAAGTIPAAPHTYSMLGNDTVTVTVTDAANDTSNSVTFTVNVAIVNMFMTPPGNQTVDAQQSAALPLGSFTQSGCTGPYMVTVNWGDESAESIFAMTSTGTIPATAHDYLIVGNDTVTLTVTDAAGHTSNSAMFSVSVIPGWLDPSSIASWNANTQTLTGTGNATITGNPAAFSAAPIIEADTGSHVVLSVPATIAGLSLQSGATLDIGKETLLINYGNGSSPLAAVQAGVQNGSILSSTANAG